MNLQLVAEINEGHSRAMKKRRCHSCTPACSCLPVAVAFLWFAARASLPAATDELRAGTARVDITPTQPVRLAGYESRKELSQGVHDPLSARVVAFENGDQHLVFVSTDNLGFYAGTAESMRTAILEACGLKASELFLCAIHTHSAPSLNFDETKAHPNNVEYTRFLRDKLIDAVRAATGHMSAVRIGTGSGSSPVGVNRREIVQDQTGATRTVLGRNASVLTDRDVQVLKVVDANDSRLTSLLFAYSTHSTSLGPKNLLISGDVHGLAEQFLEHYLGPDKVAASFAGASGNIDPWVRVLPEFRTNNGWVPESMLMGTMLGEEVARVLERVDTSTTNRSIRTAISTIQLPGKTRDGNSTTEKVTAPFIVTAARIGDIAFVGWGGEVFNEIGSAVKTTSPFKRTFIFTHCNGTAGYLPTAASYPEGGYEVQSSAFGPAAADILVAETTRLLRELSQGF
jgi:neutral ceramidase